MKKLLPFFIFLFFSIPIHSYSQESLFNKLVQNSDFPDSLNSPDTLILMRDNNSSNKWNDASSINKQSDRLRPVTINADSFPWLAEAAIADYQEAIRKDFIKTVGKPDGYLNFTGLQTLAAQGRLVGKTSASEYLNRNDYDSDKKLTIEEFVPSALEIIKFEDLQVLTSNFTKGLPYVTGQVPTASASEYGIMASSEGLFTPPSEIEGRIENYASRINGTTFRSPDGRLGAKDANGKIVDPLPVDIIPLHKKAAELLLLGFAKKKGFTVSLSPSLAPIIKTSGGIVPQEEWPPYTQPPYHPEGPK